MDSFFDTNLHTTVFINAPKQYIFNFLNEIKLFNKL